MKLISIVLAGERPGRSPVAEAAGVPCKALANVGEIPMLTRVLRTLARTPNIEKCVVVGNSEFKNALEPILAGFSGFASWQDGADSPARSAALAAQTIPPDNGVLLTTADHPLLEPSMIQELCAIRGTENPDVVVGLVRHAQVMAQHPEARCTPLGFSDGPYCGTNLFLFRTARSRSLMTQWQTVEQARKTPWRVVGILGPGAVLGYLLGRLSLARALQQLSRRLELDIGATELSNTRAALDVDTVGDWEFAGRLIQADTPGA
ncbi:MAG: nucleotidyltransferase family protein [Gammaproteobacteria bacterium]